MISKVKVLTTTWGDFCQIAWGAQHHRSHPWRGLIFLCDFPTIHVKHIMELFVKRYALRLVSTDQDTQFRLGSIARLLSLHYSHAVVPGDSFLTILWSHLYSSLCELLLNAWRSWQLLTWTRAKSSPQHYPEVRTKSQWKYEGCIHCDRW
jgi:hypothetical protein